MFGCGLFFLKKGGTLLSSAILIGLISIVSIGSLVLFEKKNEAIINRVSCSLESIENSSNLLDCDPNSEENIEPEIITSEIDDIEYGSLYSFKFEAEDLNTRDSLSWSISGTLPDGISLNSSSGILSGTTSDLGRYSIDVTVKDRYNATDTRSFEILVFDSCQNGSPGTVCLDGSIYVGDLNNNRLYVTNIDIAKRMWNDGGYISSQISPVNATSLTDGLLNTNTLAGFTSGRDYPYYAALLCYDLNRHNHDDWYLPSLREIEVLKTNAEDIDLASIGLKLYNNSNYNYWTSTEIVRAFNNTAAYSYNFVAGSDDNSKDSSYYVRCMRRE